MDLLFLISIYGKKSTKVHTDILSMGPEKVKHSHAIDCSPQTRKNRLLRRFFPSDPMLLS
jgi:hypothetical protein